MVTVNYDDGIEGVPSNEPKQPLYTKRTDKRGREMFYKDGKLFPKHLIPETIMVQDLDYGHKVTVTKDKPDEPKLNYPEERVCVMCGGPGTMQRYLNGRFILTCSDHYSETLGNIVAHLREQSSSG